MMQEGGRLEAGDTSTEQSNEKEIAKMRQTVKDLTSEVEKLRSERRADRQVIKKLAEQVKFLANDQTREPQPTGPRKEIYDLLKEQGEHMSIREISEEIGLAEATVSGYALDLYKNGFLKRGKRLVNVSPTRRVRRFEYYVPEEDDWEYID
jgi:DNA-binding transcriptional ArsR family regulator